jgi:hypothetical protein
MVEGRSTSKVVSFLYELIRDHLPAGVVEKIVRNSMAEEETVYCNGYLAEYAKEIASRLDASN